MGNTCWNYCRKTHQPQILPLTQKVKVRPESAPPSSLGMLKHVGSLPYTEVHESSLVSILHGWYTPKANVLKQRKGHVEWESVYNIAEYWRAMGTGPTLTLKSLPPKLEFEDYSQVKISLNLNEFRLYPKISGKRYLQYLEKMVSLYILKKYIEVNGHGGYDFLMKTDQVAHFHICCSRSHLESLILSPSLHGISYLLWKQARQYGIGRNANPGTSQKTWFWGPTGFLKPQKLI